MTRSASSPRAVSMITGTGRKGPETAADLEPVHAWQHEVEHDEVGRVGERPFEGDAAVADDLDREALAHR